MSKTEQDISFFYTNLQTIYDQMNFTAKGMQEKKLSAIEVEKSVQTINLYCNIGILERLDYLVKLVEADVSQRYNIKDLRQSLADTSQNESE